MQCKISSSSQTQMTVVVSVRPWTTGCSKYSNAYLQALQRCIDFDRPNEITEKYVSPSFNSHNFWNQLFFELQGCVGEGPSSLSLSENLVPLLRLSVLSPSKLSSWFQVSMASLMSNQRQRLNQELETDFQ